MLFNSLQFMIFFPIVTLLYYVIPNKIRYLWLLIASYYFYMCWNPVYALLLLFSTCITFLSGIFIQQAKDKNTSEDGTVSGKGLAWCKCWVALSFIINLSILFFFKYFEFVISSVFPVIHALYPQGSIAKPAFDVVLPVGISFYTFQALGYTVDVYRGDVKTEKNIFKYAVFVSFFPQLVAGPIERSSNLLKQFSEKHKFQVAQVRDGLLLMLWGLFQKIVIADRVAILVDQVFDHYVYYNGIQILVAMLFFAIQIYCDFGGYSNIAIGAAQVMGFSLMKNFDCPYFAKSVAEFWRRWHISLSTWFKDYLYIPLGGSRCNKRKKYRNLMIVFLCSGLWHGASWHFVIWGGLNGLYQVIGYELRPIKKWLSEKLHVNKEVFSHKLLQLIITFILVDISWVFFRANTSIDGIKILGRIFIDFQAGMLFDGSLYTMGLNATEFWIAIFAFVILAFFSVLQYRKVPIRATLAKQGIWFRFLVYITAIFIVLIFGVYGPNFDSSQFIYFQF